MRLLHLLGNTEFLPRPLPTNCPLSRFADVKVL
jgi:hypothetical protein